MSFKTHPTTGTGLQDNYGGLPLQNKLPPTKPGRSTPPYCQVTLSWWLGLGFREPQLDVCLRSPACGCRSTAGGWLASFTVGPRKWQGCAYFLENHPNICVPTLKQTHPSPFQQLSLFCSGPMSLANLRLLAAVFLLLICVFRC